MTRKMLDSRKIRLLLKIVAFSFLSVFMGWELVPQAIRKIVKNQISILPDKSFYSIWLQPPIPVYFKIYIFNMTNPEEVEAGEKPRLNEVGPYVFEEIRTKFNITPDENADTVTYWQRNNFEFRPELSPNLNLSDELTIINVPFAAAAIKIERDVPWPLNHMAHMILLNYKEPLFVRKTVDEMIFKGWRVSFLDQIESEIGLTFIPNNTFGFFVDLYNTTQGPFEISRGIQNWQDVAKTIKFKNESTLSFWGKRDTPCNRIKGTDGFVFPPLITKEQQLKVFTHDVCTTMYLQYRHKIRVSDISGYRFTLDDQLITNPWEREDFKCICVYGEQECLPGGAIDLSACRDGAPIAVTSPHFYNVNPQFLDTYLDSIESGVKPDKSKHETFIDVEPWTGIVLRARKMVQLNLIMKPVSNIHMLRNLRKMLLPLVWMEESAILKGPYADWLWRILFALNSASLGAKCLSIILAVAFPAVMVGQHVKKVKEKKLGSRRSSYVETVRNPEKSCSQQDEEMAERLCAEG